MHLHFHAPFFTKTANGPAKFARYVHEYGSARASHSGTCGPINSTLYTSDLPADAPPPKGVVRLALSSQGMVSGWFDNYEPERSTREIFMLPDAESKGV